MIPLIATLKKKQRSPLPKAPAQFLPKLSQVIDAIVAGDWWFDRDELRAKLPVN